MAGKCLQQVRDVLLKSGLLIRPRCFITERSFSSGIPTLAGQKFRISHGKARDSLAYGPLTDLPDWTYLDGSPPPTSTRKLARQKKRIEISNRIVTFLKEINAAKLKAQKK